MIDDFFCLDGGLFYMPSHPRIMDSLDANLCVCRVGLGLCQRRLLSARRAADPRSGPATPLAGALRIIEFRANSRCRELLNPNQHGLVCRRVLNLA